MIRGTIAGVRESGATRGFEPGKPACNECSRIITIYIRARMLFTSTAPTSNIPAKLGGFICSTSFLTLCLARSEQYE
jgi:hypothetical protein